MFLDHNCWSLLLETLKIYNNTKNFSMHFKCIIECQNVDMSSEQQSYYFRALHYIKNQNPELATLNFCSILFNVDNVGVSA